MNGRGIQTTLRRAAVQDVGVGVPMTLATFVPVHLGDVQPQADPAAVTGGGRHEKALRPR